MKARTASNLGKAFRPRKMETEGVLEVPVMTGCIFGLPLQFESESEQADIDTKAIQEMMEKRIESVSGELVASISEALQSALKSSVWSWRGGSRDIYDTGELASSGSVTFTSGRLEVTYKAPYAQIVHDGGYIFPYGNTAARPVYLPGRPWIRSVLYGGGPVDRFDFAGFFKKALD